MERSWYLGCLKLVLHVEVRRIHARFPIIASHIGRQRPGLRIHHSMERDLPGQQNIHLLFQAMEVTLDIAVSHLEKAGSPGDQVCLNKRLVLKQRERLRRCSPAGASRSSSMREMDESSGFSVDLQVQPSMHSSLVPAEKSLKSSCLLATRTCHWCMNGLDSERGNPTHTHTHARTRTHARTHAHTHARTHAPAAMLLLLVVRTVPSQQIGS